VALAAATVEAINAALLDVNVAGELVFPVTHMLDERGIPFLFVTGRLEIVRIGKTALSRLNPNNSLQTLSAKSMPIEARIASANGILQLWLQDFTSVRMNCNRNSLGCRGLAANCVVP
jgi:hypothetical protein